MFEALLNLMSRALEGLNSLPWGIHAVVALGMAVGLVLWLAGRRVLKPLLITLAAITGGLLGGLIVPSTSWGASLTVWHGVGLGLIAGLVVGLLLYRSAMAVSVGVVMGAALPLIAAAVLQFHPLSGSSSSGPVASGAEGVEIEDGWERFNGHEWVPAATARSTQNAWASDAADTGASADGFRVMAANLLDERGVSATLAKLDDLASSVKGDGAGDPVKVPDNLRPVADRVSEAWATATGEVRTQWAALPSAHQAVVGLAAVIGLAGGVVLGLAMPTWAAGAVTSLFGAAIWIPCLVWLSNAFGAPWRTVFDRTPAAWLAIWGVVAFVGMLVQWSGVLGGKKAKPAAPAAA